MNYYGSRNGTYEDDRFRAGRFARIKTSKKETEEGVDLNSNNSNSNDASKSFESRISNYSRTNAEHSLRPVGNRISSGPRKKSALVESMAANFEQVKPDLSSSNNVQVSSSIKSSSYARMEHTSANPPKANVSKLENGTSAKYEDEDAASTPPPRQKSGPSARRGKQQREKRMLRQKRRSTGVVRLKDSDDEDANKGNKNDENKDESQKEEEVNKKDEETTLYLSETEKNTLSNELSPTITRDSGYSERSPQPDSVASSTKTPTSSKRYGGSSYSSQSNDNVFLNADTSPQSTTMPALNSSRRRGKRLSQEKIQQDSNDNDKKKMEQLREKLAIAESTVARLTKEIQAMDSELRTLEEENGHLKTENKMLEDENRTMLRLMKR